MLARFALPAIAVLTLAAAPAFAATDAKTDTKPAASSTASAKTASAKSHAKKKHAAPKKEAKAG
jgi:hypothetical protein